MNPQLLEVPDRLYAAAKALTEQMQLGSHTDLRFAELVQALQAYDELIKQRQEPIVAAGTPYCLIHPTRPAQSLICLGCGEVWGAKPWDDDLIEIITPAGTFRVLLGNCRTCDEFVSAATDSYQVNIIDYRTGRQKRSAGVLLCEECDYVYWDCCHMYYDTGKLRAETGDLIRALYLFALENWPYHCALEPDCGSSRDECGGYHIKCEYLIGCLNCGALYPEPEARNCPDTWRSSVKKYELERRCKQ